MASRRLFDGAQIEIGSLPIVGLSVAANKFFVNVLGVWKQATAYQKVAGTWKLATPYIKVSGIWK